MNFFGHAMLAAARQPEPEFVLGSMLPDFIGMLRARLPRLQPGPIAEGVIFHQLTDEVFHSSSVFRDISRQAFALLLENGLRRGPARATAHVGIELLIDAALAWRLESAGAPFWYSASHGYSAALQLGTSPLSTASFTRSADAAALMGLCGHLCAAGVRRFLTTSHVAMRQLERAFRGRRRLEVTRDELAVIQKWGATMFLVVESELPRLLEELENALGLSLS